MKKIIISLFAIASVLNLYAQKTPQVVTVNIEQLYENFYKAKDAQEKFQSAVMTAEEEVKKMVTEGRELYQVLEDLKEKIDNPATADSAKEALNTEFQEKMQVVRQKDAEINQYRQTTQRELQQSRQSMINLHIEEIRKVVAEIAQSKGADLVLNSNDKSMAVLYFDPSFDITEEVIMAINADQPTK